MIKVVVFDIGGVTVKSPMIYVCKAVGKKFSISWRTVEKTFNEINPVLESGGISSEKLWMKLSKKLEVPDVDSLEKEWVKSFKKNAVINEGVAKIIKNVEAKGYKVAALSNTIETHEKLHRKLCHYKFFNKVFLSNKLKMRKPEVRIYQYVARKLKVKPSECIFIDDKVTNIEGARKAGMKAILFRSSAKLEKDLKKYL